MSSDQGGAAPLYTTVDDELYAELSELAGQKLVYVAVWEDSLADALEEEEVDPEVQDTFDIDLYLADGAYFELYSVSCFDELDGSPWVGLEKASRLAGLAGRSSTLEEIAVDEQEQLVIVLRQGDGKRIYLAVAAWLIEEWDELPAD
jgi:hypothetical protein